MHLLDFLWNKLTEEEFRKMLHDGEEALIRYYKKKDAEEEKEQVIEQTKQELEQNKQMIRSMVKILCNNGASIDEISRQLAIPIEQIKQYIDL